MRLNDKQVSKAIALLACGESQDIVAEKVGTSQPSVSRLAKEYQQFIEQTRYQYIIDGIPEIYDMEMATIKQAKKVAQSDDPQQFEDYKSLMTLANRVAYNIKQMAGITPTHTGVNTTNNILMLGGAEQSKEQLESARAFLAFKQEQDIQDAEVIDEDHEVEE